VIWGALNAFYFIPLLLTNKHKNNTGVVAQGKILPNLRETFQMLTTFCLTVIAWVFFRSDNLTLALSYIKEMLSFSFFSIPEVRPSKIFILLILFFLIEWFGREKEFAIANIEEKYSKSVVFIFFYFLVFILFWFGGEEQQFIYFQF